MGQIKIVVIERAFPFMVPYGIVEGDFLCAGSAGTHGGEINGPVAFAEAIRYNITGVKDEVRIKLNDLIHNSQMAVRLSSCIAVDDKLECGVDRYGCPEVIIWGLAAFE